MVSITALVITYNQEDVIGRALDSILQQKEWGLKEIVVCDDCSTDRNWEVIQTYAHNYPQYIRAYRNNPNLGIYNNLEKVISLRGDAGVFVSLAGDDVYYNGYFKAKIWSNNPQIIEKDKCEEIRWFEVNNLPENLIDDRIKDIKNYKNKTSYSEYGWDNIEK